MRFMKYIVLLILIVLTGGCLENIFSLGQTAPELHVNVTVEEKNLTASKEFIGINQTNNNTVVITNIEVYAEKVPKFTAPQETLADTFPAVYVRVIQTKGMISYLSGKDYVGPGTYSLDIGFEKEINMSIPMGIYVHTYNENGDEMDVKNVLFNWSKEKQNNTFK